MKMLIILKGFFLAMALTSTNVYAVIIEGHFYGTVIGFENGSEHTNTTGYWDNVKYGSAASGSFWYDTDKAPKNSSESSTFSSYHSYTERWIHSSFNIDDKTYSVSGIAPMERWYSESQGIALAHYEPDRTRSAPHHFELFHSIDTSDFQGHYKGVGLGITILSNDEQKPFLDGLSLVQEFNWYDVDPHSEALASMWINTVTGDERRGSYAQIDISEFHIRVKNPVNVPEPSSLILLGAGAFALMMRRKSFEKLF